MTNLRELPAMVVLMSMRVVVDVKKRCYHGCCKNVLWYGSRHCKCGFCLLHLIA